jgi:methionyl-tRNA synthetase
LDTHTGHKGKELQNFILEGEKYFLTPVCLVPNGRAHLGHVSGPILKLDVLRRHLKRCGADVHMISLSDVHESHVLIRAHQSGSTPADVANHFHNLIDNDFKTLGIEYDDFINPLDVAWADRYEQINRKFLSEIVESGNAEVRAEKIPYLSSSEDAEPPASSLRPSVGDPVVSGWLKGRCPCCSQPLVGFFCETCGGHFSPQQMQVPATAHFDGKLEFQERNTLYLNLKAGPQAILDHLRKIEVRQDFIKLAERYMHTNGAAIRLSVPSPWGISVDHPEIPQGEVIWSYSALLLACHLVAGERYKELSGDKLNPLEAGSDVKCVLAFGIDNTVPFLVGATGCALGQSRYKPFDGLLVNYFYDLDGAKFSTSRGHVIWAGDIVSLGGADVDLVRAYLCQCNPEFGRASFSVDGFLSFHDSLNRQLRAVLEDALNKASVAKSFDPSVLRYLEADFKAQASAFDMGTFDIASIFSTIPRWIGRAPAMMATPETAITWLAGFSLLASPVMPQLANWTWEQIRPGKELSIKGVLARHDTNGIIPSTKPMPLRKAPLSRAEFNACLPPHMRR